MVAKVLAPRRSAAAKKSRSVSSRHLRCEPLEQRQLLSASLAIEEDWFPGHACPPPQDKFALQTPLRTDYLQNVPHQLAWDEMPAPSAAEGQLLAAAGETFLPLTSIPALHSNPGAPASLYLDFDGHFEPVYGSYTNVTTPVWDVDGDPTTFSDAELAAIEDVWVRVSEDYGPFDIDVTTVEPAVLAPGVPIASANGVALRVAIGGNSTDWLGSGYGGLSYRGCFTSSIANVSYHFTNGHGPVANTVSHEAGHGFGLQHVTYPLNFEWGPMMYFGGASQSKPAIWYNGLVYGSSSEYQDDMAILAGPTNGFGYRADDRGDTPAAATPLVRAGDTWSGGGRIGTNTDVDVFSIEITEPDSYRFAVAGIPVNSNLDAALELRNAAGQLLKSANPPDTRTAQIVEGLTPGNYYLSVKSNGNYGWVGGYSVEVDKPPAGITATALATTWTSTTCEDGRQAAFSVVLQTQPTADVTLSVDCSDLAEGSPSVSSLVFTPDNWDVPQVVTVTGVDDAAVDGDAAYSIIFGAPITTDPDFAGLAPIDFALVNLDNDAAGFLYQSDSTGDTIQRSRLSGSQPELLVDLRSLYGATEAYAPGTLAIDEAAGKMYWIDAADSAVDRIHRANLDGSGVEVLVTLTNTSLPRLALDTAAGKMYWADSQTSPSRIQRANLDGSQIEDVVTGLASAPHELALDNVNAKIYWIERTEDTVRRANLDGSEIEILWTGDAAADPMALALDLNAGKMYWSDSKPGLIRRANLDGSNVEVVVNATDYVAEPVLAGSFYASIFTLAIDPLAGKLYWKEGITDIAYRANLDGTLVAALGATGDGRGLAIAHPGPGISVTHRTPLVTSENGTAESIRIALSTRPSANVTVAVHGSDTTEGTVSSSLLTFTPDDWNVTQTVTVTGVDDGFIDGDVGFTVLLDEAVSIDPAYDGFDPADVSVVNADNDIVTTTFTKTANASIPDRGTLTSSLTITPAGQILDLDVQVNITHGWDQDLDVFLIAPDGTRTELFTDVGGSGVNFTGTVLDDEATTSITTGSAPFTGTYRPEGNLTLLEGKNLPGTWKLEVKDDAWGIAGTLVDWSITARYTSAPYAPQAIVTPTSGLQTTESGGTAGFTVKLNAAPTDNLTIPVSSSDIGEGTVSPVTLTFTPSNWNMAQTVTVTGVDDTVVDGNIGYTIVLGAAASADLDFGGIDPADVSVTNTDNDAPTKFFVVNDSSPDRTYEYDVTGTLLESYSTNSGNTAPRGIATTAMGDKVWVVDANRKVYVYNASGGPLGSWTAGTLASNATVEDIAVHGNDIWIVDARSDKVFRYNGAASRLSGSQNASSSFSLNSSNTSPKGVVTDGTSVWVVNSSTTDKVFKYSTSGSLLGSWTIDAANATPTGLTIDPSGVSQDIWIVDSGTDRVYRYSSARSRTSGSQSAIATFALASGNTNSQGIADPPTSTSLRAPRPAAGTPLAATSEMDLLGLLAFDQLGQSGRSSSALRPKSGPTLADAALLEMTMAADAG